MKTLPRRLRNRVARLINEGELYLLMTGLLISIGVAFSVEWFVRHFEIRGKLWDEALVSLRQSIEPRDDLPHPGVQVLLTQAAEVVFHDDFAGRKSEELAHANALRRLFLILASMIADEDDEANARAIAGIEVFGVNRSAADQAFLLERLKFARTAYLLAGPDPATALKYLGLSPCADMRTHRLKPWCTGVVLGNASTVIPLQASAFDVSDGSTVPMPGTSAIRDAATATLLDAAVSVAPRVASSGASDFVQAYFISPNSVLRIWSADATTSIPLVGKSKLWAQSSYARRMWQPEPDSYHTLPYLDVTGKGFVETVCNTASRDSGEVEVIGVICTDLALNDAGIAELTKQLDSLLSVDFHWVRWNADTLQLVEGSKAARLLASGMFASSEKLPTTQISVIDVHGDAGFFVPAPNSSGTAGWIAVPAKPDEMVWVLVAGLTLLISGVALMFTIRNRLRGDAVQRDRVALLKGLPTGYFEMNDEADNVWQLTYANNRMEEMLGPKAKTSLAALLPLVEHLSVLTASGDRKVAERRTHSEFAKLLQAGAGDFYCFSTHIKKWIRLRISRVVYSGNRVSSYAVAELVHEANVLEALEAAA